MKKSPKYLAIILGMMILGTFSVSKVEAVTLYQQLTDSASYVTLTGAAQTIGTFVPAVSGVFSSDAFLFFVANVPTPDTGAVFEFYVSSSTSFAQQIAAFAIDPVAAAGEDQFLEAPIVGGGGGTFVAGTTYYILALLTGASAPGNQVRTNLSEDFLYGYIVDNGVASVTLIPGITGFTDVGISTTSQQVWCNKNFATSSGFLDSLAGSISLAACNVGVFLFVPSTNAIAQWQTLATTTESKIPFSYYYDFRNIINGSHASSSVNFPEFAITGTSWGIGSTTPIGNLVPDFTYLSSSTISQYLPPGMYDIMFLLMRSAIWVLVLFHIYRRIVPKHSTHV